MTGAGKAERPARVFLLSPASLGGIRGRRILRGEGDTSLARVLRRGGDVPLGDVYRAISSLYFRGKIAYARRFGWRPDDGPTALSITANRGLLDVEAPVTLEDLRRLAETPIDPTEQRYLRLLRSAASELRHTLPADAQFVLLGSIATPKYLDPLVGVLGGSLLVPVEFVGRGDMSRGGLMLRAADAGRELEYVEARAAPRRGRRPPRLDQRPDTKR